MKAIPIIPPQRFVTAKGNLVSACAWQVPITEDCPEGICYSFQLISGEKRVLGYDNNTGEGHHRHYMKDGKLVKDKIRFTGLLDLFRRFEKDVEAFEDENQEN